MTPETVDDLIRRVEAATGPDRELDADIMAACFPDWAQRGSPYLAAHCIGDEPIYWHAPPPYYKQPVPEITASVDAALALVEKVLPGWNFSVGDDGFADLGPCWARLFPKFQNHGTGNCYATTPPLAILLALLRALRSTDA